MTIPLNDSATLVAANLTALAGALGKAGLVDTVSNAKDVTIFAPTNEAFAAIGNIANNLSTQALGDLLKYHAVLGTVAYSRGLRNGTTVQAASGQNLTISIINGTVFINSAKVVVADVLVSNGVVHIIDGYV